ncbi:GNAT family N-acetyltransferase [Streptomyces sp. LS1784]|uniref:GNAT family N-acetyltransferase n=1 Tax=Streptomyces sp. LS1784 TaxID=2851533 RepID=UPI001CCC3A3F|nr:GNAT family N-acetyltransferase [Streptomyces sp. LS1784]
MTVGEPFALPAPLPGGLLLRESGPADLEQIGALLAERGAPEDALDHRLVVEDPEAGWSACAVVVDGDRVVSTATLLDEELRLGGVRLPAGQVELVATDAEFEGRGLVRALMQWAHARSAARGHLVQVMIGIPYFYRLFGYEYAIDIPVSRPVRGTPTAEGTPGLRTARAADLPALAALQDQAQRGFDLAMGHSPARWRWLLAHDATTLRVVERAGEAVAMARTTPVDDGEFHLAEAAAADERAARELLAGVAALAPEAQLHVVHRPGTLPATVWHELLDHTPRPEAEQYYVRIPDPAALLDRLRPLFRQRLTAAGLDLAGRELLLSTYRAHYRIPVGAQGLGEVVTGGTMQRPGSDGGVGVAPDQLAALLFGPYGIEGLSRIRPDVYVRGEDEPYRALFPPQTADLLTYYLP